MSGELDDDDLSEVVSGIEQRAIAVRDDLFADRQPWIYLGWVVFCQASEKSDGKPIALRKADIKAVRPAAPGRCGLTLDGIASTVEVYGEFMDVIDIIPLDSPPEPRGRPSLPYPTRQELCDDHR